MYLTYVILTIAAGAVLPLQALINGRLGQHLGGPLWAASVSFFVGTCSLLLFQALQRAPAPASTQLSGTPFWLFFGGMLGAFYVGSATTSVPRLGATVLVSLLIGGQLVASLLLDHFGVLMRDPHPVTFLRLVGVALLFAGAMLILRF